jgi:hypothetical protein
MDITRGCSQPSNEGPDEYFTGNTRIDPLFDPQDEARAAGQASRSSLALVLRGTPTRSASG